MGVSTNAILAFGFDLGEDMPMKLVDALEEVDQDWDHLLLMYLDPNLTVEEAEEMDYHEQSEKIKELAFEIDTHCSLDYPMYFLAIRGTVQSASRGTPEVIDLKLPENMEGRLEAMKAFCEKYDIEWKEPQWHIYSMWA